MATGLSKKQSLVAISEETTAGTYEAPADAEFIQPLEDNFELGFAKETLDRTPLTNSVGKPTPRVGESSSTASLGLEFRASGTEGGASDAELLLKGALGNSRTIAARNTTKTGNSSTVLQIEDADIGDYAVGDGIVVLESGNHHLAAITAVDTTASAANITILPAAGFTPSDNVEVSQSTVYYPADSGHPSLSATFFDANEIDRRGIGMKVTSLSLENFTTGQLASWNFELEGLSFNEVDGTYGGTPSYDSAVPPVILGACLYQDGSQLDVNNFAFSLTNTLGFVRSTCDPNGKVSSAVTNREITGSFDPYKDDTSVDQFTKFDLQQSYSLVVTASIPSSTAGEIELGSGVVIYMPSVLTTEKAVADLDLIINEPITYRADRGDSGTNDEIFISLI